MATKSSQAAAPAPPTAAAAPDHAKVEHFVMERALPDIAGTFVTLAVAVGDRLGLFKDLAANGPASSRELAARTGVQERYAREWASLLASRGYLTFDPSTERFTLPPEQAFVLATEGGPCSMAGGYQELYGVLRHADEVARAFRTGGGVRGADMHPDVWDGLERFTNAWHESYLVQQWVPAAPELQAKLEHGAVVADVGCGAGRAVVKLAQAFPKSRFVGFDVHGPNIERARANAKAAGVEDRVSFQQLDASKGLPGAYDVVTTFDVVHDAADPRGLLRSIRRSLRPGGLYLWLEIRSGERLADNAYPVGTVLYGFSTFFCMTVSLAEGGEGLGTVGLPEPAVRAFAAEAGFGAVAKLPVEDLFNVLYLLRA